VNRPVTIHIDVLAVEGVNGSQASALGAALQRELGTLIESRGLPRGLSEPNDRPALGIDGLAVTPDQPERTGAELARAIFRRLDE